MKITKDIINKLYVSEYQAMHIHWFWSLNKHFTFKRKRCILKYKKEVAVDTALYKSMVFTNKDLILKQTNNFGLLTDQLFSPSIILEFV